jgi:large subunit ribosomal protein L9
MPLEVILKKPITGLGCEADIVKVKAGYARNYLLPNDLALPATAAGKKQIEDLKKRRAAREAEELNAAEALATNLSKSTLTFQVETSDKSGKVFGSITTQDIEERLGAMGIQLDRKKIHLERPLKEVGEFTLPVQLPMGVKASLRVVLERKKLEEPEAKEKPAKKERRGRSEKED